MTMNWRVIFSPVHLLYFINSIDFKVPKVRNYSGMLPTSTEIEGDYLEKYRYYFMTIECYSDTIGKTIGGT